MKKINKRQIVTSSSMVLQFSLNMITPIALCVAIGVWIGDKYDMDWIVIPLFFLGALAGYNSIFRMVKEYLQDIKKESKKKQDVKED